MVSKPSRTHTLIAASEGEHHGGGHGQGEELDGVPDAVPEDRIAEHALVETEAHEPARPARQRPVEGSDEGSDDRDEVHAREVGHGGQDEEKARPPLAVHVRAGKRQARPAPHGRRASRASLSGSGPSGPPPRRATAWAGPCRRGRQLPPPRTPWPARSTWDGSSSAARAARASRGSRRSRAGPSRTASRD